MVVGVRGGAPSNFYMYAFRLQENPHFSIKVPLVLDTIGCLLYGIIH